MAQLDTGGRSSTMTHVCQGCHYMTRRAYQCSQTLRWNSPTELILLSPSIGNGIDRLLHTQLHDLQPILAKGTDKGIVWQTLTVQHAHIIQQDMAISFRLRPNGIVVMIGDEMHSIDAPSGRLSHDSDVENEDDLVSSLWCVGRGKCERCKREHAWAIRSCQSTQHHCIRIIMN